MSAENDNKPLEEVKAPEVQADAPKVEEAKVEEAKVQEVCAAALLWWAQEDEENVMLILGGALRLTHAIAVCCSGYRGGQAHDFGRLLHVWRRCQEGEEGG
jgi:hypothetical protein